MSRMGAHRVSSSLHLSHREAWNEKIPSTSVPRDWRGEYLLKDNIFRIIGLYENA